MAKKTEKVKAKSSSKSAAAAKPEKKKPEGKVAKLLNGIKGALTSKPSKETKPAPAKPAKEAKATKEPKAEKGVKEAGPVKAEKTKVETSAKAEKVKVSVEEKTKKTATNSSSDISGADPIWLELHRKHGAEKAQNYDMRGVFESSTSLNHKILGWGWILSNENDRLEVVFKDGKRVLISNYKK